MKVKVPPKAEEIKILRAKRGRKVVIIEQNVNQGSD